MSPHITNKLGQPHHLSPRSSRESNPHHVLPSLGERAGIEPALTLSNPIRRGSNPSPKLLGAFQVRPGATGGCHSQLVYLSQVAEAGLEPALFGPGDQIGHLTTLHWSTPRCIKRPERMVSYATGSRTLSLTLACRRTLPLVVGPLSDR